MVTIIKNSQRNSTMFRSGIVCSRLFWQRGLFKGFTDAVAHKAFTSVSYMEMGMGIRTTE